MKTSTCAQRFWTIACTTWARFEFPWKLELSPRQKPPDPVQSHLAIYLLPSRPSKGQPRPVYMHFLLNLRAMLS